MDQQIITLDAGAYEVQRVFSGQKTAGDLIREKLLSSASHDWNLTKRVGMLYNKTTNGLSVTKEVT